MAIAILRPCDDKEKNQFRRFYQDRNIAREQNIEQLKKELMDSFFVSKNKE